MHSTRPKEAFDIFIVGLGAVAVSQMTREVEQAISRSRCVLFVDNSLGAKEYLASLCPKVVDLATSYRADESRLKAYDRMAVAVLDAALADPPVTFAVYGHPRVYVYPSHQILTASAHLGLRCKVLPGVSTVDAMFCELGLDPGFHGLQMYEANDSMVRGRPLQNDVPCLLLQVGTLETGLAAIAESRPARFTRLQAYLSQFYPPEHIMAVVAVATFRTDRSRIVSFPLRRMGAYAKEFTLETTLYIPPVRLRPVVYCELLRDMDSLAHLKHIVYGPAERPDKPAQD